MVFSGIQIRIVTADRIAGLKLKYLLIIVFIVLSAIPLFAGLQYLNEQAGIHYRNQFEEHLASLSFIAKKRVLTTVDRIQDNTALVSSRTQMRISLDQWNRTGTDENLTKISRTISDAKHGLTHLKEITIYDRKGMPVASTSTSPPTEVIDPEHFDKPNIALGKEGRHVLAFSTAPLVLDHAVVGYIQIIFYTEFLTDLTKDRIGLGNSGEWLFAVRDDNGDAVFAVPLKYDHLAAFRKRVPKERVDVPITQALLGNEIIMEHAPDYRDVPVLASTRYIADLDWGLVAKIDEAEVNQLVSRNRAIIYATAFIIVIVAIGAGVALSVFISGPIEKLKLYSSSIASGSPAPPPNVGGWQEARELTTHFTYMVDTLRKLNESLNDQVAERTRELFEANKQLEMLATQDPLTGLHNRRYFDERFKEEFERAKRYGHQMAVVILDIDHFKSINDTYGHDFGDLVLKKVSEFIKNAARESDVLARIGGEEFSLILPVTVEGAPGAFLERLRSEIAGLEFSSGNRTVQVTCSFGVAYISDETKDSDALLKRADLALYKAKSDGRNCVVSYTDDLATD